MNRLVRPFLALASFCNALVVTGLAELAVISYYAAWSVEEAESRGVSAPTEGVGWDLGLPAWMLLVFILLFPLSLILSWLLAIRISEKVSQKARDRSEQANGA